MLSDNDFHIDCDLKLAEKCPRRASFTLCGHRLDFCEPILSNRRTDLVRIVANRWVMVLCHRHAAEILQSYAQIIPTSCLSCGELFTTLDGLVTCEQLRKGASL
jgi:hypothetical protein